MLNMILIIIFQQLLQMSCDHVLLSPKELAKEKVSYQMRYVYKSYYTAITF
jgi:hypothetical protein